MTLKEVAKRCLPPIIVDGGRYLLKGNSCLQESGDRELPEWEYVPQGWRTKDPRIKGWNVGSILETHKAKWPEFERSVQGIGPLGLARAGSIPSNQDYAAHNSMMAYAYAIARAARKKDRISLLDWGGGIGHYYLIS